MQPQRQPLRLLLVSVALALATALQQKLPGIHGSQARADHSLGNSASPHEGSSKHNVELSRKELEGKTHRNGRLHPKLHRHGTQLQPATPTSIVFNGDGSLSEKEASVPKTDAEALFVLGALGSIVERQSSAVVPNSHVTKARAHSGAAAVVKTASEGAANASLINASSTNAALIAQASSSRDKVLKQLVLMLVAVSAVLGGALAGLFVIGKLGIHEPAQWLGLAEDINDAGQEPSHRPSGVGIVHAGSIGFRDRVSERTFRPSVSTGLAEFAGGNLDDTSAEDGEELDR